MNFKLSLLLGLLVFSATTQKNTSLADKLWERAGGRPSATQQEGAQMVVIDDSKNGYLKIEHTAEGCGCYSETTIAAYKEVDGGYTILQTDWDGCGWRKKFLSNKALKTVLPEDLDLATFMPKAKNNLGYGSNALLYLEPEIPKIGTDTRVTLAFIPFGLSLKGNDSILSFSGYEKQSFEDKQPDHRYHGSLRSAIRQLQDSTSLKHVLNQELDRISSEDRKIIDNLIVSENEVQSFEIFGTFIHQLEDYYKVYKTIEYDTVILGWNRETGRFYIKDRMKRTGKALSFLEFVRQLPYLVAIC